MKNHVADEASTERDADDGAKVTILVPVFNGERYLSSSLDSILNQSYPNTEVIVLDDASTDRTPEILASYGDRIRTITQERNRGIYGNMNTGIESASGEYIAIYHSDDLYEPNIVTREVEFLSSHPEAGAVFCSDVFIDPDGAKTGQLELPAEIRGNQPLPYPTVLNTLLTYRNVFLRCPSCMVRADVYKAVGPYRDQQFRNTSDLEMYLRIARSYSIGVLEDHLFKYRWGHGNSGQRYRYLRTDEERYFTILDLYLNEGDREIASKKALAAFEAHRNEDRLMRVVSSYISDQRTDARALLAQVKPTEMIGNAQIQWARLLVLWASLTVLVRLPRLSLVADIFRRRWHGKKSALRKRTKRGVLA